jgi:deoxyadenosine/deoxycytidine kinase
MTTSKDLVIGLVGVCASGKTTLGARLRARGWKVRHIAQEHSFVKDMWKKIGKPDLLVFLDASYEVSMRRRQLNWTPADYSEQQRRLAHARQHADFYIQTDSLIPEEVELQVVTFIEGMENEAG